MKYFVMLRGDSGEPFAIINEEDDIALYDSREAAEADARVTFAGNEFGYRVYEWRENGELEES